MLTSWPRRLSKYKKKRNILSNLSKTTYNILYNGQYNSQYEAFCTDLHKCRWMTSHCFLFRSDLQSVKYFWGCGKLIHITFIHHWQHAEIPPWRCHLAVNIFHLTGTDWQPALNLLHQSNITFISLLELINAIDLKETSWFMFRSLATSRYYLASSPLGTFEVFGL